MTAFWHDSTGKIVAGNSQLAFTAELSSVIIPNGTTAKAMIKKFELIEKFNPNFYDSQYYEITWQLIDGDYKDIEVKQKIKCFDREPKTKDRALEMMMLLFKLCQIQSTQQAPTVFDLLPFTGKVLGIKIREWQQNGKEGNWVSEVHLADNDFKTTTGKKLQAKSSSNSYQHLAGNDFAAYDSSASKVETDVPF